jgi:uncharacterized protein (TIGR03066 family)
MCHVLAMLMTLSAAAAAPEKSEKITPDKLIGKWQPIEAKKDSPPTSMEFTKDGKARVVAELGGQSIELNGTYTLTGNQLRLSIQFGDNATPNDFKVVSVTSDRLLLVDSKKNPQRFQRVKKDK